MFCASSSTTRWYWNAREFFDVAVEQRVGCENEVGVRDRAVVFPPLGAVEHQHAQVGGELERLRPPVRHHRGGRDHQRRPAVRVAGCFFGENVGEGLQGFAEAHVIGQDAVQAVAREELHPAETGELIVAQRRLHAGGAAPPLRCRRNRCSLAASSARSGGGVDAQALQSGERGGVQRVQPRLVGKLRVDERREVVEDAAHAADRQAQRVAIGQRRVDMAGVRAVEGFLEEIAF